MIRAVILVCLSVIPAKACIAADGKFCCLPGMAVDPPPPPPTTEAPECLPELPRCIPAPAHPPPIPPYILPATLAPLPLPIPYALPRPAALPYALPRPAPLPPVAPLPFYALTGNANPARNGSVTEEGSTLRK
ncbi:hypothetical protein GCK32_010158 [Trichostrongylus colubriformis]|uniref:Uncharacterized protein n=1 Tax=Trichostrongylus colubriformis TaxID=6319 RepID=A0AAN8F219_TRICO